MALRKVDLHLHSYASDGEWSAKEIIEELDRNSISIFSVTDHDDVRCVTEIDEQIRFRSDLTYIKGVEATVTYKGREHHILTYFIDAYDPGLLEVLERNRQVREAYNNALMDWLSKSYPHISPEAYRNYIYNPFQGGWRAFGYLIDNGVIDSLGDYFAKTRDFYYEKIFISPEYYLAKMKKLGYKTVLAHPPAYVEGDFYEEEHLDHFRELGLDGIECYSQYLNDPVNAEYYVAYCQRYGMMITGGSDCHGNFAGRRVGYPDLDESMIRL